MSKLASPAPWASETRGLAFGATNVKPYSPSRPHKGKDYKWSVARPIASRRVVAPHAGVIEAAFNDGLNHDGWGNYVDIRINKRVKVRLAHHVTGSVKVRVGQKVKVGDAIGTMGSTGEANGIHLHEELWIDDVRVNPDLYRGTNGRQIPGTTAPKPTTTGGYPNEQVTTADVNLRKTPESDGDILAVIPRGTVVKTGKSVGGIWVAVRTPKGRTGFVHKSYIMGRRVTNTVALNLRSAPNTADSKNIIRVLPKGVALISLDIPKAYKTDASPWRKVRTPKGSVGWVATEFLKGR